MMSIIQRFAKGVLGLLDGMKTMEGEWVTLATGAFLEHLDRFSKSIENSPKTSTVRLVFFGSYHGAIRKQ